MRTRVYLGTILTATALVAATACGVDSEYVDEENSAGGTSGGSADDSSYKASKDLEFTKCAAGEFGLIDAVIKITNNDDKPRSYLVTGEAVDAEGNRVSELNAVANSVRPGQSVDADASGSASEDVGKFECKIVTVDSFRD